MNIKLSYNKALLIQRSQLSWYRRLIGLPGLRKIRTNTEPCPPDIHPDQPISIFLINKLIPRGGSIEYLIRRRPMDSDNTRMATYEAIRKGLM